ncbi:MAG: sialate O-acetylesterase, partial [Bacteroidales bacterium]|nr:sialate O-acetylesterase [Bacteroidales bacterium]
MKKLSLIIMSLLLCFAAGAESLIIPEILKGDVVLQQQAKASIWGKATPGAKVTVATPWNQCLYELKAGADSLWKVKIATPDASFTPYDITITSGEESYVMKNVLFGDVWVCGGQSNMEMPLKGMFGCHVDGAAEAVAMAGMNKGLRYVTVQRNKATESDPGYFTKGSWTESSPATASDFSATGFFFGQALSQALGYPIGLISCNWSGSFVEDWMSKELIEKYPSQTVFGAERTKAFTNYWYGMLEPTTNYTIKGMIWYQGESNVGSPDYTERLAAAVAMWKERFGLEKMPFYQVELAPFSYNQGYEDKCPYLREQQYKAGKVIPDGGMISTYDLAYPTEATNIHPARKRDVGRRLAYTALSKAYGNGQLVEGPVYKSMSVDENGVAVVSFDNVPNGFQQLGDITGFEIAGEDKVFYPAKAVAGMNFGRPGAGMGFVVRVSSDKVKNPVAVRYCFRDFTTGNLYNVEGWPA